MPKYLQDYEQIYTTHFTNVYLFTKRLCGTEELAQEITAETFAKAIAGHKGFSGQSSMLTWLCTIAKNTLYTHWSKHANVMSVASLQDFEDFLPPSPPAEDKAMSNSQTATIHMLIGELAQPYREIFMLRVFGELSFRDIGLLFGKTDNWASVTFFRARHKLQAALTTLDEKDD